MRLIWHQRPHLERKLDLAGAFHDGLPESVQFRIEHGFKKVCEDADALVLFGIGGIAKTVCDAYREAGKKVIFLDKGYSRRTGHWRVSVNAFQPLAYFQCQRPYDRFYKLGIDLQPYKKGGDCILFDGSSNKYVLWKEFGDLTEWGAGMVRELRDYSRYTVLYRPRPTHNEAVPIYGAELSQGPLSDDLARARVVVSYGGNIGWDAVVAGVPHFALGDSIARPISETDWNNLDYPRIPTERERHQWCADVAYCQFTEDEFRSGEAWTYIEPFL